MSPSVAFGFHCGISSSRASFHYAQHGRNILTASPRKLSQSDNNNNSEKRNNNDGVIDLVDLEEDVSTLVGSVSNDNDDMAASGTTNQRVVVAPFLSQGEIQEETLKVDLSNPKQTRVIIYIILSLLPVLFLIPLMLGSREFLPAIIPMDELPPVQM